MISDVSVLAFTAVAAIFGIPLLAFLRVQSASNPGAYFGIVWAAATLPAIVLAPFAVTDAAVLVIAAFVLSATVGSMVGESIARAWPSAGERPHVALEGIAATCSAIGGIGGLLAAAGYLAGSGYSLSELTRAESWLAIAAQYSVARYQEGFVEPLAVRVFLAANYAGALFGGLVLAGARTRLQTAAASLPILASVLVTLITTAKGAMLTSILLTASAGLAGRAWLFGRERWRFKAGIALTAVVLALATVGSLGLRYGSAEADLAATIADKLGGYFVGHVAAFSAWLQWDGVWDGDSAWGLNTFAGLSELFGLTTRVAGIYREIALNSVASESNVFTAFRGLILDFSFPGAIAVIALASAAAGHAWRRTQDRAAGARSFIGLVAYLAFVGWSPVISLFVYNVIVLALAVFALVIIGSEFALIRGSDPR